MQLSSIKKSKIALLFLCVFQLQGGGTERREGWPRVPASHETSDLSVDDSFEYKSIYQQLELTYSAAKQPLLIQLQASITVQIMAPSSLSSSWAGPDADLGQHSSLRLCGRWQISLGVYILYVICTAQPVHFMFKRMQHYLRTGHHGDHLWTG
jgi:hypothetical protein